MANKKHGIFIKSFFESVLKSGANNIGRQLLEAVDDETQPADVVLERIVTAVKSGAVATGRDVLRSQLSQLKS